MLAITTDYAADRGCPGPCLARIAAAGFDAVHWCHHWNTDFLYAEPEIDRIERWLSEYGLKLLDLHASAGCEKNWGSHLDYERRAGVELVENRIRMTARLGGDVAILHVPDPSAGVAADDHEEALRRSLDAIEPVARGCGVRIAFENRGHDDFRQLRRLFDLYDAGYAGLCYDAGHGNLGGRGPDHLEETRNRLLSVHLHDNDGTADRHGIPFTGTVDWERLAGIVARSAYGKCVSLESNMRGTPGMSEETFLARAREAGERLARMIGAARRRCRAAESL